MSFGDLVAGDRQRRAYARSRPARTPRCRWCPRRCRPARRRVRVRPAVSTAVLEASEARIRSSTCRPQRCTHLLMLAAADCAQTTRCACTSRRTPVMPTGIADAFLRIVEHVFARDGVQDALVGGDRHGLRRFEHAVEVGVGDFAVADRRDALRVAALHVVAGDRGVDRADFAAGHQFGFLDRALDRLHGGFDVDDHAALQPARFVRADADHLDRVARRVFADQRRDLRRADVEADDQRFVAFAVHVFPCEFVAGAAAAAGGASVHCSANPLV